ncbi:DUF760 domain-containing protein [Synechococcus sp. PCC 7336]|uniref:DUF760 domain-containing protein n=1 Tax=Synechococcus sp. PCC 7336 TaxID=195250 RepID=UPI00034D7D7D|nr:DUF760 domain-containing protein [Synechococcus sp. PCC 7336]
MPNSSHSQPDSRRLSPPGTENALWQYLQARGPQTPQDLAEQVSKDALEVLSHHLRTLLGTLPPEQFDVQIVTNRENLAQLLSGAVMTGYYLRSQEQKLQLEQMLEHSHGDRTSSDERKSS